MRLFFRIILFLIFLESFFRIGGAFTQIIRNYQNHTGLGQGEYRIMCLGESMSYDGGDDAYPNQLQALFHAGTPSRPVKIINKALPGAGSGVIVDHASAWLDKYQPHMAIVMMGVSDYGSEIAAPKESPLILADRWMSALRIYRLGKKLVHDSLLFERGATVVPQAMNTAVPEPPAVVMTESEIVLKRIAEDPAGYRQAYLGALALHASGKFDQAEALYQLLIHNTPEDYLVRWMYFKLADVYRDAGEYRKFSMVMKHFLDGNPQDPWVAQWTWKMCRVKGAQHEVRSLLEHMIRSNPKTGAYYDLMSACLTAEGRTAEADAMIRTAAVLRSQNINIKTKENYVRLLAMLRERGIIPVFVQYPRRDIRMLKDLFAGEETDGAIFVDNQASFDAAVARWGYDHIFKDAAGGDFGHCTRIGYGMLARNIFDRIIGAVHAL